MSTARARPPRPYRTGLRHARSDTPARFPRRIADIPGGKLVENSSRSSACRAWWCVAPGLLQALRACPRSLCAAGVPGAGGSGPTAGAAPTTLPIVILHGHVETNPPPAGTHESRLRQIATEASSHDGGMDALRARNAKGERLITARVSAGLA